MPVPVAPGVELAGRDVQSFDEPSGADLGLLRPAPHEIHDLVLRIVGNPEPGQSSLTLFLGGHAPPSVRPKLHRSSESSSPDTRFVPVLADGWSVLSAGKRRFRSRRTPSASGRTLIGPGIFDPSQGLVSGKI
jgi:hypothetical protein